MFSVFFCTWATWGVRHRLSVTLGNSFVSLSLSLNPPLPSHSVLNSLNTMRVFQFHSLWIFCTIGLRCTLFHLSWAFSHSVKLTFSGTDSERHSLIAITCQPMLFFLQLFLCLFLSNFDNIKLFCIVLLSCFFWSSSSQKCNSFISLGAIIAFKIVFCLVFQSVASTQ